MPRLLWASQAPGFSAMVLCHSASVSWYFGHSRAVSAASTDRSKPQRSGARTDRPFHGKPHAAAAAHGFDDVVAGAVDVGIRAHGRDQKDFADLGIVLVEVGEIGRAHV